MQITASHLIALAWVARSGSLTGASAALQKTQPAVSQHLRVLRSARLVRERRAGTRHYFCADPAGLEELRKYVDSLWDDVLAAFAPSQEDQGKDGTK